jgi:(E)-4-hydroxy-3-methylbut-2-enyl-diphosphate synthase
MRRSKTKEVKIGNIKIGGGNSIAVQSMTKTLTEDTESTIEQIHRLEQIGCQLIRVAVPNRKAASALKKIIREINIPIIADIHFDYMLAIRAIEAGANKIRINPGNIGDKRKLKEIIKAAKENEVAIRIGINSGSIEKSLLRKYGQATPEAMVESALNSIKYFEDNDFRDIVISLKANDIKRTVEAYRLISTKVDYPLHLGITEAGTLFSGTIKSAIGIGILLYEGIGDTIRVSLSADPEEEVKVAYEILKALDLYKDAPVVIACPTCSRAEIDVQSIAKRIESEIGNFKKPIKIAVMGCVVNGPGEAIEADIGVSGSKGISIIFKRGKIYKRVKENQIIQVLMEEIKNM